MALTITDKIELTKEQIDWLEFELANVDYPPVIVEVKMSQLKRAKKTLKKLEEQQ